MIFTGLTGTPYELSDLLGRGGEGTVYRVLGDEKKVAKIYGTPSSEQEEKLLVMVRLRDPLLKNVAYPSDVIYDANKQFCGFVMPKLDFNVSLDEVYEYPPHASLRITNQQKIHIARNICAVIAEVHNAGCVCGDFSPHNIGIDKNTGIVSFLDADSYQVFDRSQNKTYRCPVVAPGYAAPEILEAARTYARSNGGENVYARMPLPTFTQESDNFALAIHIFKLLMNGSSPYDGIPYSSSGSVRSPGPGDEAIRLDHYMFKQGFTPRKSSPIPRLETFPQEIQDLFTRAFIDGRRDPSQRPSAQEWYDALKQYEQCLVACRENPLHQYDGKNRICPYCEADQRYAHF